MTDSINKLFAMCKDINFDKNSALEIIQKVNLNADYAGPQYPNLTETFLLEACTYANIEMVKLLLENGADPNYIICEEKYLWQDNAFWTMQYYISDEPEEYEMGLKIAQLMLEYGASPSVSVSGEDLFSYVCDMVFNDDHSDDLQLEYRQRFFILLIAYGGSNEYCKPDIIGEFDKTNMAQYYFKHVLCADHYHLTGEIIDNDGNVIATV